MNGPPRSDDLRHDLRTAYDAAAESHDQRELAVWKQDIRASFLRNLRTEGRRHLLEIGSGPGHDGAFFAQAQLDVTCVDLSPEMVRRCREKGLEAHVMNATNLRFPDESFDAAYSFNALLHLPHAEFDLALLEVRRVLRPESLFFLGVYGGFDHEGIRERDDYEPKRFFAFRTDERLLATVDGHFDVVSFQRIPVESDQSRLHFQSLVLRRPADASSG